MIIEEWRWWSVSLWVGDVGDSVDVSSAVGCRDIVNVVVCLFVGRML
jgi:hypothetical protein